MKIGIKGLVRNGENWKGAVNAISYDFDEETPVPVPLWKGQARLWKEGGGAHVSVAVTADTLENLIDAAAAALP